MSDLHPLHVTLLTGILSKAAGGLSSSVPRLAANLKGLSDIHTTIVGVADPAEPQASIDWGENVHAHTELGPPFFHYAPALKQTLRNLSPDVIDVQGLWTYPSLANLQHYRKTATPYVITPRGMLDPWALSHSAWKKRLVRYWFENAHLRQAACLRATAEMEANHFRSFGLHNPIAIVPNGVDIPLLKPKPRHTKKRILLLSRLHPKKGISYLLRAWQRLSPHRPDWELVIAGPDEIGHQADMMALAGKLKLTGVSWHTPVYGEEKSALYQSADLFVLPTHGENFGLVIAEALAHEVPVITTKHAPWSALPDNDCGWWIDLTDDALHDALKDATALPQGRLETMGANGRVWMEKDYGWEQVAEKMAAVYRWVSDYGSRPDYVVLD